MSGQCNIEKRVLKLWATLLDGPFNVFLWVVVYPHSLRLSFSPWAFRYKRRNFLKRKQKTFLLERLYALYSGERAPFLPERRATPPPSTGEHDDASAIKKLLLYNYRDSLWIETKKRPQKKKKKKSQNVFLFSVAPFFRVFFFRDKPRFFLLR